jgi:hypothetical protein
LLQLILDPPDPKRFRFAGEGQAIDPSYWYLHSLPFGVISDFDLRLHLFFQGSHDPAYHSVNLLIRQRLFLIQESKADASDFLPGPSFSLSNISKSFTSCNLSSLTPGWLFPLHDKARPFVHDHRQVT